MENERPKNAIELKTKVESGKAKFAERNIWNIIQKKMRQGKSWYFGDDNCVSMNLP